MMIELTHLVKEFGDLTAVDDLSLTVGKGEFFAVLGPNAAGKTTTIKMLVGLIAPTTGTAKVCGYDVQTSPSRCASASPMCRTFRFCMISLRRGNSSGSPASYFT